MKSIISTIALACVASSVRLQRQSNSLLSSSQYGLKNLNYNGYGLNEVSLTLPLSNQYSGGAGQFLSIGEGNPYPYPIIKDNIYSVASSNSVEKPVQDDQDTPPQPQPGPAIIPQQPPPAVPVNAVAANVPANNGAVFLGSGSLGVIDLGNGQYALGAGGIGYSNTRQQPRPSATAPLFPPLPANPSLVPAATPSQVSVPIPQAVPPSQISPNGFHFSQPLFVQAQPRLVDQNGYESLTANDAGFGSPTPTIRHLKTTSNYATPSQQQGPSPPLLPQQPVYPQQPILLNPQQLQPQFQSQSQQLSPAFGGQVLQYPTLSVQY